jgi:hypothetical protein
MPASHDRVIRFLPKGWPRRVRSAAVHAVSMANVVFTVTRSRAENHFNARVRLQAENDRLRNEVALLREELRIKDHRMEQFPPQRRPHPFPIGRKDSRRGLLREVPRMQATSLRASSSMATAIPVRDASCARARATRSRRRARSCLSRGSRSSPDHLADASCVAERPLRRPRLDRYVRSQHAATAPSRKSTSTSLHLACTEE